MADDTGQKVTGNKTDIKCTTTTAKHCWRDKLSKHDGQWWTSADFYRYYKETTWENTFNPHTVNSRTKETFPYDESINNTKTTKASNDQKMHSQNKQDTNKKTLNKPATRRNNNHTLRKNSLWIWQTYDAIYSSHRELLHWSAKPYLWSKVLVKQKETWRCGGQIDSMWDSECTCHGFESQCCQLTDHVTSLGKMWTPCLPHLTKV